MGVCPLMLRAGLVAAPPVCSPPWLPFVYGWPQPWRVAERTSCKGAPSHLFEWTQIRTMIWRGVVRWVPRHTPMVLTRCRSLWLVQLQLQQLTTRAVRVLRAHTYPCAGVAVCGCAELCLCVSTTLVFV